MIWKRLYKTNSGMERGTLYQLRNLINRRNVVKKVKTDMNACEDFFELVVTGHVVACAMHLLGMSSIDEIPSSTVIQSPEDALMKDDSERKSILIEVATLIVEQNVDLSTSFSDSQSSNLAKQSPATDSDSVYAYSSEVLSLGLLFLEFKDSIRPADGDRDFIVWKYFLLLFKASKRTNYSIEAFTLLSQYHLILAPHLAEQLKWSRFINTQGLLGHNISCDLHMEHLNRQAKIDGLGANKSQKAIQRTGKAIGTLTSTLDKFDMANSVAGVSGHHSVRSSEKDLCRVINQLVKSEVFDTKPGRTHKSFPKMIN